MQRADDVEAVFAAIGMAPVAYRVFPPRPAAEEVGGRGPAVVSPCPEPQRRGGRNRPDVGRPEGRRHPGRALR